MGTEKSSLAHREELYGGGDDDDDEEDDYDNDEDDDDGDGDGDDDDDGSTSPHQHRYPDGIESDLTSSIRSTVCSSGVRNQWPALTYLLMK